MQEEGEDEKKRGNGTGGDGAGKEAGEEEEQEEEEEEAHLDNGSNKALTEEKTRGHHAAPKAVIISFPALYYPAIKRSLLHLISHDLASSLGR